MKRYKRFWHGFWYGFILAAVVLACAVGGVAGMATAQQRTRANGFGDDTPAVYVATDEAGRTTLTVFGWQFRL